MAGDNMQKMIERYKRELVEFNRKNPQSRAVNSSAAEMKMKIARAASSADTAPAEMPVENQIDEPAVPVIASVQPNAESEELPVQPMQRIRPQTGLTRPDVQVRGADELSPEQELLKEEDDERLGEEATEDFVERSQEYPPYGFGSEPQFDSVEDFLEYNRKTGYLRVQAFASDQSIPIGNAKVIVSKPFNGAVNVFYTELTDVSGIVYGLTLPAPDKNLSAYPTSMLPYATYTVRIEHPRFATVTYKNCAIFDGIETIQTCSLVPLTQSSEEIVYDEEPNMRQGE